MPLSLRRGSVTAIVEQLEGLVRLDVDGAPCIAYPQLTGPVGLGDDVVVNVQARKLELGSGGFDVLYANLSRGLELPAEPGAHVMKLPYTPLQVAARHAEETIELPATLGGMAVVCCSLHSQVAPVCAGVGAGVRVAYVQIPGGALPLSLSDTLRTLKARGLVETGVAAGACLDGDVACTNIASALLWARHEEFDVTVCSIGPGIVGTGTSLGHGGLAGSEAANAASALGGVPIIAIRASSGDLRERHRGVSHHSRAVLQLCLGAVITAWPKGEAAPDWLEPREEVDVSGWERDCADLPLEHMGRKLSDDRLFFATAFAAGRVARNLLQ